MLCIIVYMNSSELIKKLKADGWHLVNVKGSHHQFKHESKEGKVTIKHPVKDIPLELYAVYSDKQDGTGGNKCCFP